MADKTGIEWTEATWNPLVGCSLKSPGCTHCYAMSMAARIQRMTPGSHYAGTTQESKAGPVWTGLVKLAPDHILTQPLRWSRPRKIFVNSMSDLFHESVPDEWIDRIFAIMALAPQHTFQVLTKRSARMREYFSTRVRPNSDQLYDLLHGPMMHTVERTMSAGIDAVYPLPNVWLGVSVEDQARADERIPDLLATPAAVRWLSMEPLLGPVSLDDMCDGHKFIDALRGDWWHDNPEGPSTISRGHEKLDWVVVGGESGHRARPMHPDWARSTRDQCAAAGVPFLFKQWGEWLPFRQSGFTAWHAQNGRGGSISKAKGRWWGNASFNDGAGGPTAETIGPVETQIIGNAGLQVVRIGKKRAGRLLDGIEHNGYPEVR